MQLVDYEIALTLIPGIGDVTAKQIISYCGGVQQVFQQRKHKLLRIPGIGEKTASSIANFKDFKRVEQELKFIQKHKINTHFYLNADYPTRLKAIEDAPIVLYSKGEFDFNHPKIVGVVGTRKITEYGRAFVEELIEGLKATGCMVLSGLAYGVDIASHKAALKHGLPTVGVLAHGLDRIYPPQHVQTAAKMITHGGLITEFPSGTIPDRENFPKRNRIVAGLCDVLIVVETAERGGAMITAEIANSYNKDIMALPGRVHDEFSEGCNKLIRQNKASMITKVSDLFELMNWDLESKTKKTSKFHQPQLFDLNPSDLEIVNYVKQRSRVGFDDMALELSMDAGTLSLKLLDLEFRNIIRTLPGKYFELV